MSFGGLGIQKISFSGQDDYALLFFSDQGRNEVSHAGGVVSFDKSTEKWKRFHDRIWSQSGSPSLVLTDNHLYIPNLMNVSRYIDGLGRVDDLLTANSTVSETWKVPLDEGAGFTYQSLLSMGGNYQVFCMVKGNTGEFIMGGQFLTAQGFNSRRVARWNGTSWQSLGTGIGSSTFNNNHRVNALAFFSNNEIYAHYSTGVSSTDILRFDGTSWALVGTAQNTTNLVPFMVKDDDGKLTIGGSFTRIGGITATRVAVYDPSASTWSAPYEPGFNAPVDEIRLGPTGQDMYFMGLFTNVQGVTANYLTRKPKGTTAWVNLNDPSTSIYEVFQNITRPNMFFVGSTLWCFLGNAVTLSSLKYSSSITGPGTWTSRSRYAPYRIGGEAGLGTITTVVEDDSKMYTSFALRVLTDSRLTSGHCLVEDKNDYSTSMLRYNLKRDRGDFLPSSNSSFTLTTEGVTTNFFFLDDYNGIKNLYIGFGGTLQLPGVGPRSSYKWDGSSWSRWCYTNGTILAIIRMGANIFLTGGGSFQDMINFITRYDGTNFNQMGTGLNSGGRALATDGSNLYVGGDFTTAGGVTVNRVAKWNGTSWSALNTGTVGMNTGGVYGMHWDSVGSKLYAFGTFTNAGGVTANRAAVWDSTTSTWSALSAAGATSPGLNGSVFSSAFDPEKRQIYLAGSFTTADGMNADFLVMWDIASSTYQNVGPSNFISTSFTNNGLYWDEIKKRLYVSGRFRMFHNTYNNLYYHSICYWDGTSWNPIRQGRKDSFSGSGSGREPGKILALRTRDVRNFNSI